MHKRIIAFVLIVIMSLSLSSCSDIFSQFFTSVSLVDSEYVPENNNIKNSLTIDKTQLDEDVTLSKYYDSIVLKNGFNTLDTYDQQTCYLAILEHSQDFKKEKNQDGKFTSGGFSVLNCSITERELSKVFEAVLQDNPQLFWLEDSYSYAIYDTYVSLDLHYTMSQAQQIKAKKQLNAVVNDILSDLKKGMSEFQLELYMHDYIVKNCVYNKKAAKSLKGNSFNVYGALVQQKAVCQGYTDAFQLLLSYVGINSYKISGKSNGVNHVWNVVNIGNKDYYVDVTWDDTKDYCMYDYFNITTKQLKLTHTINPLFENCTDKQVCGENIISFNLLKAKCNSNKYNYYVKKGCHITSLDDNNITDTIISAAENKNKIIHFYIDPNYLKLNEVYEILFGEGYKFSDYINEANRLLQGEKLNSMIYVTKKEKLDTITVELKYE